MPPFSPNAHALHVPFVGVRSPESNIASKKKKTVTFAPRRSVSQCPSVHPQLQHQQLILFHVFHRSAESLFLVKFATGLRTGVCVFRKFRETTTMMAWCVCGGVAKF